MRVPIIQAEMWEGLPGSGKSFRAVKEVLRIIMEDRRPVYTNLPIRMRVMRAWLRKRGGEVLARLIQPMTREHFTRFLDRQEARQTSLKAWQETRRMEGRSYPDSLFARLWLAEAGPDIYEGPKANWIPSIAVVFIDEVHLWFPASDVMARRENPNLQRYLSMHRHHGHSLYFITQDRMQMSVTIRRLCVIVWTIRNRAEDKIAWGIRLKHFGVQAFGYARFTSFGEDSKNSELSAPIEEITEFPWLPSNKWLFRLYDSFTHVGGLARMKRLLDERRHELGVDSIGIIKQTQGVQTMSKAKALAICIVVGLLSFVFGNLKGGSQLTNATQQAKVAVAERASPFIGKVLNGVSNTGVVMSGVRIRIGESFKAGERDVKLLAAGGDCRGSLWQCGRVVWLWERGQEARLIGTDAEVAARISSVKPATGGSPSVGIQGGS